MILSLLGYADEAKAMSPIYPWPELPSHFAQPPDDARPWVFWHWMNGNISKEGITQDLEAMRKNGVGGVLIVDVKGDDSQIPEGPVPFDTPEFWDLLKFAISEADRLGLKVRMNPGAGWSAGGPWITPELSMQHVVSSEITVTGSSQFDGVLPTPPSKANYYRDIAVVAFPSLPGEGEAASLPKISGSVNNADLSRLGDGTNQLLVGLPLPTVEKPVWVQFEFPQAYAARMFALERNVNSCKGELEVSDDGITFRKVRDFKADERKSHFNFEANPSRYFRVVFTGCRGWEDRLNLKSIQFSPEWRIDGLNTKIYEAGYDGSHVGSVNAKDIIAPGSIINLTKSVAPGGKLTWKVPTGSWTILRLGMTTTGMKNRVARPGGEGLECDKLNPAAVEAQWNGFTARLLKEIGPLAGKTFLGTFIDSYETDYENWTPGFEDEFKKARGYDIGPFLPALTGRVVGSAEMTDRFFWDFRRTLEDLFAHSYSDKFAALDHQNGLDFMLEPYAGGPFDNYTYGRGADVPMEEFWVEDLGPQGTSQSASIGHLWGRTVIAAESFTGRETSEWKADPYFLKKLGDAEFARGINQFVLHSYAHQPWPNAAPGMTFDKWGTRFERTNTWWNQGVAWLRYISRSCFLLRQGLPVADVVGFSPYDLSPSYAYDSCDDDAILNRMTVKNGRIVLPDGMSYRVLTLPPDGVMTLTLLRKIGDLVKQGATIFGPKPLRSPSLEGYPAADGEFTALAHEIWDGGEGKDVHEHVYGAGRVIHGIPMAEVLKELGATPDFQQEAKDGTRQIRYLHRHLDRADLYFLCNPTEADVDTHATFRVAAGPPALWHADTGQIENPAVYAIHDGETTMPVHLDPHGSVFVLFPDVKSKYLAVTAITGEANSPIITADIPPKREAPAIHTNFTVDLWALPAAEIALPPETTRGILMDGRNDAVFPVPGHELYGPGHAGAGISVGTNGVMILEHSAGVICPVLVQAASISTWTHIVVVYQDEQPTLYIDGKLMRKGLKTPYIVHPGTLNQFKGELRDFTIVPNSMDASAVAALPGMPPKPASCGVIPGLVVDRDSNGSLMAFVGSTVSPGSYNVVTTDGQKHPFQVDLPPASRELKQPWKITFPPNLGAPDQITLPSLISWTESKVDGVKHFSGTACYHTNIEMTETGLRPDQQIYLDLGEVRNIAEVFVNGQSTGILWKVPFRANITSALHIGANDVEIRVTNLWPNRLIGDEQLPAGPEWTGTHLNSIPQWVLDGKPDPTGRITFTTYRPFTKDSPLLPSGLLGPVTLQTTREVPIR